MATNVKEWKLGDPMINENDYWQDPDYVAEDPEKEKLVLKLATMITDRYVKKLTGKINNRDPEYWMLDMILTKEQVKFLINFKKTRVPYSIPELAQMNNMSEEETTKMVERLRWIGIIEQNRAKTSDKHLQYELPIFVPGSAEFMMMQEKLTDEFPQLATFFNLMTQLPLAGITQMVPPGGAGIGMHVIPVEKAIELENQSVPVEHLSRWIDMYDKFGISECSCRKQQAMRGEGSGEIRGEYCIGMGDMAEYMDDRGIGHYVSKEEVYEILKRAERHGYVHQITNIDGEGKIVAICNCAPGVCNALRTSQLYNTPNLSASAYRAHVEKDKCVACGKCVEVCPVGAAKLGQKLCKKDGSEVKYPKTQLPDNKKWGPDKWNYNYRDDAKINCYETGTAPCKTACPVHLSVQGYIKMAAEGRYEDALKLIKQDNPFPMICGAVCNRRCEDACTRGTIDEPLAIDEIKKFIASLDLKKDERYIPLCEKHDGGFWSDDYKVAVIGGGPAGLSAAFFLRENGYPVTVFEKERRPGGMLMNGIPSYRLEKDIIEAEIEVIRQMGVEIKCGVEVGKDLTIEQLRSEGYKAFFVAIGMQGGRLAGVPGEDAAGVQTGVDFLRTINQDHSVKLHGGTVVVGGGNVAIDVARTAVRAGASKVTMLCLESEKEMPAAKDEVEEALEEGIEVKNGWGPKEVVTENGHVKSVIFKRCTNVFDSEHRFAPVYDENDTIEIPCENLLLSIGQSVQWGDLLKGTKVELNRNGTAKADPLTRQTAEPDIFVGGDVFTGAKFAIDAIAGGREGFVSINRFVHKGNRLDLARDRREFIELDKDDIQVESFDNAKRQIPGKKAGIAKDTFEDLRLTLTEEQVKAEASRCLGCGATTVDENRCIGCGLCTTKCEFDAIHLSRDIPKASTMYRSEDKLKAVGPYAAKRAGKILINKITGDKK
ncbi:NADPH-dependent glutamate synthase beta chain [Butyrivibrio hungatei DSM 14810]|uniref:NADPH-dependent glutamate synthase beta chain n=2 Tax=Butyrivibrio hungatei TaxID=185008 RepID=A0A1M7RSH6_9FIRM|nr:FAD-dependent oxidoreductase [Butyrivibrio hungatei]SHN49120.1 NADPH-dependent glutamate synthase beta chain [Butyrivibrio hungatei DSM 14810]